MLAVEHVVDSDSAKIGDDQLQEQLTAEIAEMRDRRVEPLAKLRPSTTGGGQDRAVAARDTRLLPHRVEEFAGRQLVERPVRQGSRHRPHSTDVARRLQSGRDGETVRGFRIQDPEAGPLAEQQVLCGRAGHRQASFGSVTRSSARLFMQNR